MNHVHLAAALIEQQCPHNLCAFVLIMSAAAYSAGNQVPDLQGLFDLNFFSESFN
jgi:hypothetical protein